MIYIVAPTGACKTGANKAESKESTEELFIKRTETPKKAIGYNLVGPITQLNKPLAILTITAGSKMLCGAEVGPVGISGCI